MSLLKRLRPVLLLALVFSAVSIAMFFAIAFTQSPYSTPSSQTLVFGGGMDIEVGPPPNATDISLDTAITVDALASATISNLHVTPEVSFAYSSSETTSPLTYLYKFYPTEPLTPATTYTASATIMDTPVSWKFTTTTEPFKPTLTYTLSRNALWIALATAASATAIAGFILWLKEKQTKST